MRTPLLVLSAVLLMLVAPATAAADGVTNAGDDRRTGWYPTQSSITPQSVGSGSFGRLWSTDVVGQVYAQPLVSNGTVFVATEDNHVYGLEPGTGQVRWHRQLAAPWKAADVGCPDLAPNVGVTATPVIDEATRTAYFTSKSYASGTSGPARWDLHAVDVTSGAERPGFPVKLDGRADNAPEQDFAATTHLQRPGLLLLDGVVYASFGAHCDVKPWQGWIFGVSTGGQVKARWVAATEGDGAGIWQSGAGLTSDRPGSILLSTGNGASPSRATPGTQPPGGLGNSIVRLIVQPDGTLRATDFFTPFDADVLDRYDADFGSGGIVALPEGQFGTAAVPRVGVTVGKAGYVYLLDRDDLGGKSMGPSGSDQVVQRLGPYGGVWSRPGAWPGDGGYVYVQSAGWPLLAFKHGQSAGGRPTLSQQVDPPKPTDTDAEKFGFGSGSPVITSNGTAPGSALVWVIWASGGAGTDAQLRAYDPVPAGGRLVLRKSFPIGAATKFAVPGVGGNRLFVGTRDGKVHGFGSPVDPVLTPAPLEFPATTVGSSSERTLVLTATKSVSVSAIQSSSAQFRAGATTPALPASLSAGQELRVPITFTPARPGPVGGSLTIKTSAGDVQVELTATGRSAGPDLEATPTLVSFGGAEVGGHRSATVSFRNVGAQTLTVDATHLPAAPFGAAGAPAAGHRLAPGEGIVVTVSFDPTRAGTFDDRIALDTDGGDEEVGLTANAGDGGELVFSEEDVEFGKAGVGGANTSRFSITNTGDTAVKITKSKPPIGSDFEALSTLAEGAVIEPGQTVRQTVRFTASASGLREGVWIINGDDGTGLHEIRFWGFGAGAGPSGQPMRGFVNMCANVEGGDAVNAREVELYYCEGADSQSWTRFADGSVRSMGKCLDAREGGTANGTRVQLYDCNGTGAQRWDAQADGTLRNVASGRCLDVTDNSAIFGTPLQLWDCSARANQRWRAPALRGELTGGAGKCLDVPAANPADGASVQLWDCNTTGAQFWSLTADGAVHALGKCLDVAGAGTGNGTRVQLFECNGTDAQRWVLRADGTLRNPRSGRCLDAVGQQSANGTRLQLWDCWAGANQRWALRVAADPEGEIRGLEGKCVDVAGGVSANGTAVQLWDCFGSGPQRWRVGSDGTVRALGKCLDIPGAGVANGTKVQLYECNDTGAQRWAARADGTLVNPASGRCLDATDRSSANGTRLQIWDCGAGANQRWRLPTL